MAGIILILASIGVFVTNRGIYLSVLLLFTGGLALRFYIASLDPILKLWDEQYHAVTAKNMLDNPLKPMLYKKHYVEYTGINWTCDTVWLYKPPLFMWQIALSYKIFGINLFAVRFPSIIMAALVILLIFRMGSITVNMDTGYLGALLYTMANCQLEFVGTNRFSDHNDQAFMFYITASIWAWTEYYVTKKKIWLIATGLFSGMAVLVKWMAGILVYSGWGIVLLTDRENVFKLKHYRDIFMSFCITVLIAGPWQLYIAIAFPDANQRAIDNSVNHVATVLDGHYGEWWFHFKYLNYIFGGGELVPYLIGLSLIIFPFFAKPGIRTALITCILITYIFFSFVQTKMAGFCVIVAPLIYILLGNLNEKIFSGLSKYVRNKYVVQPALAVILVITGYLNMSFYRINKEHDPCHEEPYQLEDALTMGKEVFLQLNNQLPKGEVVIFNCRQFENIACMFYTDYTAYDFIPSEKDYLKIKNQNIRIAVFDNHKLPEYLLNDKDVIKIKTNLFPE